jgi:hypothetical protein
MFLILYLVQFQIDFALRNRISSNHSLANQTIDGPLDLSDDSSCINNDVYQYHLIICGCDKLHQCVLVYRRCIIDQQLFHSLIYSRRNSTVSYFVQYRGAQNQTLFGKIRFFFALKNQTFAFIEHHSVKKQFSDFFSSASYHDLLCKSVDYFFYVLHPQFLSTQCVPITEIEKHCIIFEMEDQIIVTPLSVYNEHD